MSFWLQLPAHSGSLKRIDYPKQICLIQPLSLNVFTALKGIRFLYFISFDGLIWILIASVPDLCIHLNFIIRRLLFVMVSVKPHLCALCILTICNISYFPFWF